MTPPAYAQTVLDQVRAAADRMGVHVDCDARPIDEGSWFLSIEAGQTGIDVEASRHVPTLRLHTDSGTREDATVELLLQLLDLVKQGP